MYRGEPPSPSEVSQMETEIQPNQSLKKNA